MPTLLWYLACNRMLICIARLLELLKLTTTWSSQVTKTVLACAACVSGNITAGASRTDLLLELAQQKALTASLQTSVIALQGFCQFLSYKDRFLCTRSFLMHFSALVANVIFSPLTVYVGVGQQFTTLQAAITWASSKVLAAVLTISGVWLVLSVFADFDSVVAGTYNMPPLQIYEMPNPQLLRIVGSSSNPSSCNLVCTGTCNNFFIYFNRGTRDMLFSGFQISTATPAVPCTGMLIGQTAVALQHLVISRFHTGIWASESDVALDSVSVLGVPNSGIGIIQYGGSVSLASLVVIAGVAPSSSVSGISSLYGDLSISQLTMSNATVGLACYEGFVWIGSPIVWGSGVTTKYNCPYHN